MLKIGLTGGIGCGKSTVARLFEQHGAPVIDADRIAHQLVAPGRPALSAIVDRFGPQLLDRNGGLDRAALRDIVFSSPVQRKQLEAILHPLVYRTLDETVAKLASPYCILCIPLLIETGGQGRVSRVLVVDCPTSIQIGRVIERDHMTVDQVQRILAAQCSREERLAVADDIIDNTISLDSLAIQVEKLHNFYLSLSNPSGLSH